MAAARGHLKLKQNLYSIGYQIGALVLFRSHRQTSRSLFNSIHHFDFKREPNIVFPRDDWLLSLCLNVY